ncbi:MAG: GDSL-type esterase/lipase family protein [Pseudomonadota bacterium]
MGSLSLSSAMSLSLTSRPSSGSTPFSAYPALAAAWVAGHGVAAYIGDSLTCNIGGGVADYTTTFCKTIISDLNAAGKTAIDGFQFGTHTNTISNPFAYDARLTSPHTGRWSTSGNYYHSSDFTVGTQQTFTPGLTHDRVRKGNIKFGYLSTYTITRNAVLLETVTDNAAGFPVSTYTVASGTQGTVTELASYGGFGIGVWATPFIQCYPSATQHIQICQMGEAGTTAGDWLVDYPASALSILNIAIAVDADAYFIMLGANDQRTGVSDATFEANIDAIVVALLATGADVRLIVTPPAGGASASSNISAGKITALSTVSTNRGLLAPIDCNTPFSPFNAANYLADGLHLTNATQIAIGNIISATML